MAGLLSALPLALSLAGAQSGPAPAADLQELPRASELMKTVRFLAAPERAGRLSGTHGYTDAATRMAAEFAALGLKPLGDSAYFQFLRVECNEIIPPLKFSLRPSGQPERPLRPGVDFVCRGFSGSGIVSGPIVFCGYGLSEPGYDDYRGVDVRGKVAMIFKATPSWTADSAGWHQTSIRQKAATAHSRGAAAVIFLPHPADLNARDPLISVLHGKGEHLPDLPQLAVGLEAAEGIFRMGGQELDAVRAAIDSLKHPRSFAPGVEANLEVHAVYDPGGRTMNVVGMLEGSDPALKKEYLVVGAHLDHVGSQAALVTAPGANDNASGSAAVLEIARAFVKNRLTPKRSVVFALFASEEQGLLGSLHFVNRPPVSMAGTCAMLNLDCIGVGDSIQIGNGKSAPALWDLVRSLDAPSARLMVERTWNGGGADGGPFHEKGIPMAYFVTTNSYTYLHSIRDRPETFNEPLFEHVVQLAFRTAVEVAAGRYSRESVRP